MKSHRLAPLSACIALSAAAQQAPAPAPAPAPAQQIQITGGRDADTDQRRQSTAAKIVIGREEIDKYGDASIGEVLRRLPGVTAPGAPGRGGAPRMRGLGNGYTQILVDGERMPPGFSLESLPPEQVERIEILRAPTAETGARAIAGTINIITREGFRRRANDVRPAVSWENGGFSDSLNWTHNNSAGDFIYNVSGSAFTNRRNTETQTRTVDTLPDGTVSESTLDTGSAHEIRKGTSLNGRLQWRLPEGDSVQLTPSLFHMETRSNRPFTQQQDVGGPPPYDNGETNSGSRFTNLRLNGQWRQRLGDDLRMELGLSGSGSRSEGDSLRVERTPLTLYRQLQDTSRSRENSVHLRSKFSQLVGESEHSLVGGLEAEAQRRHETRISLEDGNPLLSQFGDTLEASTLRLAAYAQDEWNLTQQWAVHAGLRWEGITTRGEAVPGVRPTNRSSVATPLLHAVWKPDPKSRDQLRFSLTRSYRSPSLDTLIAKPRLTSKVASTVANDPTSPDRVGNPDLKPELATGIDVAAERYLEGGGLISANLFHRRITNLMRAVVGRDPEIVSWSSQPRYVSRQQNIGRASTSGLELEAKGALDQIVADAPRVELRANAAFYRSKVDSVPGPDNRLDQQARATANLGADYRFRAVPLSVGGNVNWVPGYETQESPEQRTGTGRKRVFDLYALWTFSPAVGLRVLANNLAPLDYETTNTITTPTFTEAARTFGPSYTNWQLRLELKL